MVGVANHTTPLSITTEARKDTAIVGGALPVFIIMTSFTDRYHDILYSQPYNPFHGATQLE